MTVNAKAAAELVEPKARRITAWDAFGTTGDAAVLSALVLAAYAIFFGGPWQAPVSAAAYWLFVQLVIEVAIWYLDRENDRLWDEHDRLLAEIEHRNKIILDRRSQLHHLELVAMVTGIRAEEAEAKRLRLEAELREAWIERGRREERARLQNEFAAVRATQLEIMANQLEIRVEQLEARRAQVKIMAVAREIQQQVEEQITSAYASGYVHGGRKVTFSKPNRPQLTLVDP